MREDSDLEAIRHQNLLEIERLRNELRLGEIEAKRLADLCIEDRKAEHAMELEAKRGENALAAENRRGMFGILTAIGGVVAGVALTTWANNRGISQRDVEKGASHRKLLR